MIEIQWLTMKKLSAVYQALYQNKNHIEPALSRQLPVFYYFYQVDTNGIDEDSARKKTFSRKDLIKTYRSIDGHCFSQDLYAMLGIDIELDKYFMKYCENYLMEKYSSLYRHELAVYTPATCEYEDAINDFINNNIKNEIDKFVKDNSYL